MKIILTKDVQKLGKKYDIKDVSSGHAMNLLIPQGLAIAATHDAIKKVRSLKEKMEGESKVQQELLAENFKTLENTTLNIVGKANEKGHLFAGIHKEEIAKAISDQTRIQVLSSFIDLEHPLKMTGDHTITIKSGGKSAKLKVVVVAK